MQFDRTRKLRLDATVEHVRAAKIAVLSGDGAMQFRVVGLPQRVELIVSAERCDVANCLESWLVHGGTSTRAYYDASLGYGDVRYHVFDATGAAVIAEVRRLCQSIKDQLL